MLEFVLIITAILLSCLFVPSTVEKKPLEHQNVFLSGTKFSSLFQKKQ